jgi:ribosomal protein L25 (general stress protein Ctc)
VIQRPVQAGVEPVLGTSHRNKTKKSEKSHALAYGTGSTCIKRIKVAHSQFTRTCDRLSRLIPSGKRQTSLVMLEEG